MNKATPKDEFLKITVEVSRSLLDAALEETGKDIEETVRAGLEKLKASHACKALLALGGAIDLELDLGSLREDRDFEESRDKRSLKKLKGIVPKPDKAISIDDINAVPFDEAAARNQEPQP